MPAELLRDVLRAPDASRRTRSFSMLPISIAAHALAALAIVIIPLAAEVERPDPAPLAGPAFVKAQPLPPPPAAVPNHTSRPAPSSAAPTSAPSVVEPEPENVASSSVRFVPGAIGVEGGPGSIGVGTVVDAVLPPPPPVPPQPTLVRPGGQVREPKKIVHVPPVYPDIARNNHIEGLVILEAVINEAGVVERIKVLRSHTLLDSAAIEAVKQWRYTPTLLNGTPVSVLMTITVNFKLN